MVATLQFSVLGCTHFFVLACHVADSFVADRCCLGKNVTFMNNLYPGPLTALAAFDFSIGSHRFSVTTRQRQDLCAERGTSGATYGPECSRSGFNDQWLGWIWMDMDG